MPAAKPGLCSEEDNGHTNSNGSWDSATGENCAVQRYALAFHYAHRLQVPIHLLDLVQLSFSAELHSGHHLPHRKVRPDVARHRSVGREACLAFELSHHGISKWQRRYYL